MKFRSTLLYASIMSGLCLVATVHAQDTSAAASQDQALPATDASAAAPQQAQKIQAVTVTGYRASLQKSLNLKRNAASIVDAISAEDVGKFPSTNVAESLAHLPGVTVDRQFGEGNKVSILGTDPALNRVLLNGQTIASTSWGGDPNNPDSRSFDYSIIAPEIISNAEVYKSPQARIQSGSIGGTVVLNTRKPLDLKKNFVAGSLNYNYNDRSAKSEPGGSVLYSWKNDAGTFGVLGSLNYSDRHLRRDGVEIFGYGSIQDSGFPDSVAKGKQGVYPTAVNSALFTQERKRRGGTVDLQWKPNDGFQLNFTGLYVNEDFNNVNQSRYTNFSPANATSLGVTDGVATSGTYNGNTLTDVGSYFRKTSVKTASSNLRADWFGDGWQASTQVGYTRSSGGADQIYGMIVEGPGGVNYNIDHKHVATDFDVPPSDLSNMSVNSATLNGGDSHDSERYFQADFSHDLYWGPVTQIMFGVRSSNHSTGSNSYYDTFPANPDVTQADLFGGYTPSSFLDGVSVGPDQKRWPLLDASAVENYVNGQPGADVRVANKSGIYDVGEQIRAAYAQLNFSGDNYRGNIGVRYAHTRDAISGYQGNSDANYVPVTYHKSYGNWLPSFNFTYNLTDDLLARFAVSKVIARPRYGDLAPHFAGDDITLTGSAGNPELDPYKSTNYDGSLEWYFAPNSVLSGEVFYRKISNYILDVASNKPEHNVTLNETDTYLVTEPENVANAKVKGVSVTYQGEFGGGFGISANYTYSKPTTPNNYNLPYNSRDAYNISPYFEKGPWTARVTLSWRSSYFTQIGRLDAQQVTDDFTQLGATVSYAFNDNLKLQLSGSNLLDETYYQYDDSPAEPYYIYKNGRTYMASLQFTL